MLDISWSTVLFQVVNFVVMALILWRFLFKPVLRILDERSAKVTRALDEAESQEREAHGMRVEYEQKLGEAEEEAVALRQQAQEELARTKKELINEARSQVAAMREKAQGEIQAAREQAIYQHRRELGRLVTTLSARMMRESSGKAFQEAAVEQFIQQLASLPAEEYRQGVDQGETSVLHVHLVSAEALGEESVARIEQIVSEMADQSVEVIRNVDPTLVAGATLRFGDVVVDGSLAGQLEDLQKRYVAELEQEEG